MLLPQTKDIEVLDFLIHSLSSQHDLRLVLVVLFLLLVCMRLGLPLLPRLSGYFQRLLLPLCSLIFSLGENIILLLGWLTAIRNSTGSVSMVISVIEKVSLGCYE